MADTINVDDGSSQAKNSSDRGNNSEEVEAKPTPLGQFKVFSDPIHGLIEMHPLMVKIIDTPQFQRLRGIKQLGGTYYVYPSASHTRFEHSLGVAHLAGQLVEALRRKQPELKINDKDVLCVKIAGLCHDLGHGPFSHLFDGMFIPLVPEPDREKWKHEQGSVGMFEHLIKTNKLEEHFKREGLGEADITFIKEQINPPEQSEQDPSAWLCKGRVKDKSFLYEIVANKWNGMDVDKWDYFARDCHHLGIGSTFDHRRYMASARVLKAREGKQICARDKDASNLYDMFYVRKILHQRAYQHKTKNAMEFMVRDILVLVNNHITIPGSEEEKRKMSECIYDMTAYTKLDDSILDIIKSKLDTDSRPPELADAWELICRLKSRRLYKFIGQSSPIETAKYTWSHKMAEEILSHTENKENGSGFKPEDLLVHVVTFDYSSEKGNPVDKMRFYSKDEPDVARHLPERLVSKMLPSCFSEKLVRLYYKKEALSQPEYEALLSGFQSWCKEKDFIEKTKSPTYYKSETSSAYHPSHQAGQPDQIVKEGATTKPSTRPFPPSRQHRKPAKDGATTKSYTKE